MRIGILTFHRARNYGAVLQAYALQTYLESLGHHVFVIDYRPSYIENVYRLFKFGQWHDKGFIANLKWNIREILVSPIRWLRNYRFERFVSQRLHLLRLDLDKPCADVDMFVFGSDQIWNPVICNGYDKYYLADAEAFEGKKCIAYAVSVGRVANIESDCVQLLNRLSGFDLIGVRENSFLEWLKANGIANSVLTLDPVMMVGRECFEPIAREVKHRKPFLLLFMIEKIPLARKIAELVARENKLDVVELTTDYESLRFIGKEQAKSPEYCLGMIKAASYIVTTSFHATALSILFNKDFMAVSSRDSMNERIQSLLSLFGLESRLSCEDSNIDTSPIDYDRRFSRFEEVKKSSETLLKGLAVK